ncbi:MAG: dihydroorotase [Oscillospiraceae bacterium]|jgi:dihydroorotase|nr:dihydroorotase [Oscillospiraceae bacterium]
MKYKMSALFDMHVHFRDPGQTHKETLDSGSSAAYYGGFDGVLCMPNTVPVVDTPELVKYISGVRNGVQVYAAAAITKGLSGVELTDFAALKSAGAIAVTDDGKPVSDPKLFREALLRAEDNGLLLLSHSEDLQYIGNADETAAEYRAVEREVELAVETNTRLHLTHISCEKSLAIIREAKRQNPKITCDTAPHYFSFSKDDINNNTNFKMNPPLRAESDRRAVISAIKDRTIDAIITDHAPHSKTENSVPYDTAPNGIIGLETSLTATISALYHKHNIPVSRITELMSDKPREILRLPKTNKYIIIDTDEAYTVNAGNFKSLSRNCPWNGVKLYGTITDKNF